jgi:hypothetical protein
MTAKTELMQAHEAMAAVLDAKFAHHPEWKAFRAIDRALLALEAESGSRPGPRDRSRPNGRGDQPPSYTALTDMALQESGKPVPTKHLMEFIAARRKLDDDAEKAKVTVTSTLSKSPHYKSVQWEGGRAWWYANRPAASRPCPLVQSAAATRAAAEVVLVATTKPGQARKAPDWRWNMQQ